jgi:hypothetical protein
MSNQLAQDSNAFRGKFAGGGMGGPGYGGAGGGLGGMAAPAPSFGSRVASKASKVYDNRSRDLVDAAKADSSSVEKLSKEKLPEEMQKMTVAERKKFIADKAKERQQIQEEIKKVAKEREAHIAKELAKNAGGKDTFGDAICSAIDQQLTEKGFGKAKK